MLMQSTDGKEDLKFLHDPKGNYQELAELSLLQLWSPVELDSGAEICRDQELAQAKPCSLGQQDSSEKLGADKFVK